MLLALVPVGVASVFLCLGVVGLLLCVVACTCPRRWLSSSWEAAVKIGSEGVQVASAGAAAWGAYRVGTSEKEEWVWVIGAGLSAVFAWKVFQVIVDFRVRSLTKSLQDEKARAARELDRQTRMATALSEAVGRKVARIAQELTAQGASQRTIGVARDALTPERHLKEILHILATVLQEQARADGIANPRFRIGIYLAVEGFMRPMDGIDTHQAGYNPFTSFERHRGFFEVAGTGHRARAVLCVRQKTLQIVEDCEKRVEQGDFQFFDESQRVYLKSIAAQYLGQVRTTDRTMVEGALVIDTPCAGFFREADRDAIDFLLSHFAKRIALELALKDLLTN